MLPINPADGVRGAALLEAARPPLGHGRLASPRGARWEGLCAAQEQSVGALRPAVAPRERAASTKNPAYGSTGERASSVDERVQEEVRRDRLDRLALSEQSAGPAVDGGRDAPWEFVGDDTPGQSSASAAHIADHPEEVVRNVVGAMELPDAVRMWRFIAMSKKDLTAACQDQRVATSGTNLCRAMELTAVGAVPEGAPPDEKVRAARRIPELFQSDVRLEVDDLMTVSYTHLTLPTSDLV